MGKPKKTDVSEVLASVVGKPVMPHRRLPLDALIPNDWNANKLTPENYEKLTKGMKHVLEMAGVLGTPIVARPHPTETDKFQIIDGEHRWRIAGEMGLTEIDAYVIDVDTKTAMLLTSTLNYLRGEPDPEKQAHYLYRLLQEQHVTVAEASSFLPQTEAEVEAYLDAYDLHVVPIDVPDEAGGDPTEDTAKDALIDIKVAVYREQADVIERELARIGSVLTGKNIRGRALEYMAVNSSQTPLESFAPEVPAEVPKPEVEEEEKTPRVLKARLRKKAS